MPSRSRRPPRAGRRRRAKRRSRRDGSTRSQWRRRRRARRADLPAHHCPHPGESGVALSATPTSRRPHRSREARAAEADTGDWPHRQPIIRRSVSSPPNRPAMTKADCETALKIINTEHIPLLKCLRIQYIFLECLQNYNLEQVRCDTLS